MDIRRIALQYYTPGVEAEGLERVSDPEILNKETVLFVPNGNDFQILEDIAVKGPRITGLRTHEGDYNPNRRGYPVPMVSLTRFENAELVEVSLTDEVFLII